MIKEMSVYQMAIVIILKINQTHILTQIVAFLHHFDDWDSFVLFNLFIINCCTTSNKMSSHVHSLNNSPAKQKYSFGKEGRFHYNKPQSDVYYYPNSERDRRSALIGYGERSLGVVHSEKIYENIPHSYNVPSMLEVKKGNAFKGGRYEIGSYLNLKQLNHIPGPNNYTVPSMLQKKGASLKSRLADFSLKEVVLVPGPGAYTVSSTLKVEEKPIADSKFTNPSSIKIHNSLDISRRREPVTFQPGPGQYDVQKYGIGNPENPYGKNEYAKFPKSMRDSVAIKGAQRLPGPGQYKVYSEFD